MLIRKTDIHILIYIHITETDITQKQNTFILFPSLFNKKWFPNLDEGELHSSRNQAAFI